MKIYKLPQLADSTPDNVYHLDRSDEEFKATGAYLIYARMRPGETGRELITHGNLEEIIYIVKGRLSIRKGKSSFPISAGEAFVTSEPLLLDNPGSEEAVYIAVGANTEAIKPPVVKQVSALQSTTSLPISEVKNTAPQNTTLTPQDDELEITAEDAPTESES
ncbi:cupin domain-containing protein [bacterium]|nr:MAG: cupin domain-containing protein [bacterium]